MKIELILIGNRPVGYNLVPEKAEEQDILKTMQSLHFLADCKQKRIAYDGVSSDKNGKPNCMYFIQNRYASLPPESKIKQLILKMSGEFVPQIDNSKNK